MILTYKRKLRSLKSSSFYERLCGDPLAECSAAFSPIEDSSSNGCCSMKTNEAKHKALSEDALPNSSNPPIKFKYTRRSKRLQQLEEPSQRLNGVKPDSDNTGCISCKNKPPLADQINGTPGQDNVPYSYDSCSRDQCDAANDAGQLNSGLQDIGRCSSGSFSSKISDKKEKEIGRDCSESSPTRGPESDFTSTSIVHKPDYKDKDVTDDSICHNCHRLGTKPAQLLLTYCRRSRKDEGSRKTYVDLLSERSNFVITEWNIRGSAGCHTLDAVPDKIECSNSCVVVERSPSFSTPIDKLTDEILAVGGVISGQRNQKEGNSCQSIDDVDGCKIPSLNDEVVNGHQPDDAIKPHRTICDLSLNTVYEEPSFDATMQGRFQMALENSQNKSADLGKAGVTSKTISDLPGAMNSNVAASINRAEAVLSLRAKALRLSLERNLGNSVPAEARMAKGKELLDLTAGGVGVTNGLPDINLPPSKDGGFISQNSKMVYSNTLPNASTNNKILQLFPEDISDSALQLTTSNSGLVPAVTYNNNSVTKAQPDLNVAPQESNQDKMFEPSSNQERHKLLMDSIRSWNGPQIRISEGFPQNIQVFASYWSEEELDNLWVGVRRHGKENWHAMLRDPKLRFSPWRTERALAEKWMMEQPKLLGNTLGPTPYYQYVNPAGIALPPLVTPGLGAMTRFLTDATQFSLSNAYLNNPGMFPPRPPHASTNAHGNGSRLFNRRVRAHKRSGNTWGRFRARNRVPTPTPLASRSRNDITPSGVGGTLELRHFQPPLPAPPLSLQHSSNSRNGINSSNTGSGIPGLGFPSSQPIGANTTDPKRPKNVINLESDASSEGTISDK